MGHHASRSVYDRLTERLNRFPQGAPPAESLFRILEILFSEREAALVSLLPIRPFTARQAAAIWKVGEAEARSTLDALAGRALLVDWEGERGTEYVLPPPMAGFFEFSLMRVRTDIDQKALAELFHQYLNVEEDFVRALFAEGETQLGRAFVQEAALSPENALHVLDFERASEVIRTATHRGISLCYCRHKMEHVGKACDAPQDICMTFNASASSLIRHGHAREVGVGEAMELLHRAQERDLVQFGENVREGVNFICNCCGCCCEAMIAARRFAAAHPIHTTHFLPASTRVPAPAASAACAGARSRRSRRSPPTTRSARSAPWPGSTRIAAWAAASASAPAGRRRSPSSSVGRGRSRRPAGPTGRCSWPSSAGSCRTSSSTTGCSGATGRSRRSSARS